MEDAFPVHVSISAERSYESFAHVALVKVDVLALHIMRSALSV
jgi:hypothetical protein